MGGRAVETIPLLFNFQNMGKYKYFELSELIKSETATKKKIDNTPSFEIVDHLNELVKDFLEPLRAAWGKPIRVTSGYRCDALNKAVKGSSTSVHKIGYAADLQSGDYEEFRDFVVEWVKKNRIKFDQLIKESDGKTNWIHIGLKNNAGQQRGQIKVINV